MGWDGMGRDGMGRDGTGWDGAGWDGEHRKGDDGGDSGGEHDGDRDEAGERGEGRGYERDGQDVARLRDDVVHHPAAADHRGQHRRVAERGAHL